MQASRFFPKKKLFSASAIYDYQFILLENQLDVIIWISLPMAQTWLADGKI